MANSMNVDLDKANKALADFVDLANLVEKTMINVKTHMKEQQTKRTEVMKEILHNWETWGKADQALFEAEKVAIERWILKRSPPLEVGSTPASASIAPVNKESKTNTTAAATKTTDAKKAQKEDKAAVKETAAMAAVPTATPPTTQSTGTPAVDTPKKTEKKTKTKDKGEPQKPTRRNPRRGVKPDAADGGSEMSHGGSATSP